METSRHGHLVLADISGFTSYLTQVELDHAHAILSDLLEAIVGRFRSLLTICKLEGDAVFAYADGNNLTHGETLLELLESTYAAFRDGVEAVQRRTTCECRACRAIPSLDLKFFMHYGEYIAQNVAGIHELVGSDVNLIHRLMKNHISEATGWKAYILFTENGLNRLRLHLEGLHPQIEHYEHLGDVQTFSLDIRARYDAMVAQRRIVISEGEAHIVTSYDFPVPPPSLWDWLNDPQKRSQYYSMGESLTFLHVLLPGGRRGVGTRTHCVHGKKLDMIETVLDWRPFDYYTVDQSAGGQFTLRATFRLTPTSKGTHLEICQHGRGAPLGMLNRPITRWITTRLHPTIGILKSLDRQLRLEPERS